MFKNFQEIEGLPDRVLERGIEVRWSSLFKMLKSFVDNKRAIDKMVDDDMEKPKSKRHNLPEFSKAEWRKMENVMNSLEVFCEATTFLQSRDASISLVLPLFESLKIHVQRNIDTKVGDDTLNQELLMNLKVRFDAYKNDKTYILATFLNPNFKMKCLNITYKQLYFDWIMKELVSSCHFLNITFLLTFFQTADDQDALQTSSPAIQVLNSQSRLFAVLDASDEKEPESEKTKTKKQRILAELLTYTQECAESLDDTPSNYWKRNEIRFPFLCSLFKKYGTAPATSAEVERLFSLAGNIVTDMRKRITAEKLEMLLFLNANLPLLNYHY